MKPDTNPPAGMPRPLRYVIATVLLVLGAGMAAMMTVATVYEIVQGSFFGMCVSCLIVLFGGLVVRSGLDLALNRRRAAHPEPMAGLLGDKTPLYPYLPHSHIEYGNRAQAGL